MDYFLADVIAFRFRRAWVSDERTQMILQGLVLESDGEEGQWHDIPVDENGYDGQRVSWQR